MNSKMLLQIARLPEVSWANFALEGAFTVSSVVIIQMARCLEADRAKFTFERSFIIMNLKMALQIASRLETS